jgi:hypothetical protein
MAVESVPDVSKMYGAFLFRVLEVQEIVSLMH